MTDKQRLAFQAMNPRRRGSLLDAAVDTFRERTERPCGRATSEVCACDRCGEAIEALILEIGRKRREEETRKGSPIEDAPTEPGVYDDDPTETAAAPIEPRAYGIERLRQLRDRSL